MEGSETVVVDLRARLSSTAKECTKPLASLTPQTYVKENFNNTDGFQLEAVQFDSGLVKGCHQKLHPLVHTADLGFSQHYNLSFSPDDFLLPLLSQLALLRNLREQQV